MSVEVFDYKDYKIYLLALKKKLRRHGLASAWASAINCQPSYISQVLKGAAHLSLEQAQTLSQKIGHNQEQTHFFLLLVQLARAGTKDLKTYFDSQIKNIQAGRLVLKNRINVGQYLSEEQQAVYYSQWYYAAIHILITIPKFRTKETIRKCLGLDQNKIEAVIDFLLSTRLAIETKEGIVPGETRIHLTDNSVFISRHHTNWRLQAIRAIEKGQAPNLHYSSVISIAAADVEKIKENLIHCIQENKKLIKESKEEELFCFDLDFFKM